MTCFCNHTAQNRNISLFKLLSCVGWRDSTVENALALHAPDLRLMLGIPDGPPNNIRSDYQ